MIEIIVCVAYGIACLLGAIGIIVTLKNDKEDGV